MQIDITAESLLRQLKISVNDTSMAQMNNVLESTPHALKFFKHIFSLNDALSHYDAFIAPSSSKSLLKIKLRDESIREKVESFNTEVLHWSQKYKVELEKVSDKEVYYIKGMLV